jgi:hypothetical protein
LPWDGADYGRETERAINDIWLGAKVESLEDSAFLEHSFVPDCNIIEYCGMIVISTSGDAGPRI